MIKNHTYNLLLQLVQEHKSLWRIKNEYVKDGENCQECLVFWKKMEDDKEKHVIELQELIKKHPD